MEHRQKVDPENFVCPRCGKQNAIEPLPLQEEGWICYHCDKAFRLESWVVWNDDAKELKFLESLLPT